MNATDTVTLIEGYDAMRIFLESVSLRLGKTDEEIDFIVAGLKWTDGAVQRRSASRCHQRRIGAGPGFDP